LSYSESCKLTLNNKEKAVTTSYVGKIRHYEKILAEAREKNPDDAVQPQLKIVPFALESTGFIYPKSFDFDRTLLTNPVKLTS
jgi:hypothetical protein